MGEGGVGSPLRERGNACWPSSAQSQVIVSNRPAQSTGFLWNGAAKQSLAYAAGYDDPRHRYKLPEFVKVFGLG